MDSMNKLQIIFGESNLGVRGKKKDESVDYLFSYGLGGPVSIKKNEFEWLYRVPRPAFWRATTDNDRGNGFSYRSAAWMGADQFIGVKEVHVLVDDEEVDFRPPHNNCFTDNETAQKVTFVSVFETATTPSTMVKISYTVDASCKMEVKVNYYGKEELPELPALGLRFLMPTKASRFRYTGLSGETYPDRMAGGISGTYEIEGLPVTPYMAIQECGMHMNTEEVRIYRRTSLDNRKSQRDFTDEKELCFSLNGLAFTALPYTPMELESAGHMEELPPARRTVLTVYGAVRGVGGIDSWGADVEEAYHISAAKDYEFSFCVS